MCSVKWDFGDGTAANTLNASHTYTQWGTYKATVTVTDVRGSTGTATVTVIVQSPPIVNAGTDTAADVGQPVDLKGTFTDPDGTAPYKYIWKFGDGNTKSGTVQKITDIPASYAYTQDGVFTATLEVTDKEGNTGTSSLVVNIRGINTDACATGVATVKSNFDFGMWNNPGVWNTGKVPGPNDWVLIQGGHTIILPDSLSSSSTQLQIKGLCIAANGVLQSAFNSLTLPPSWINIFAASVHNQGSILSSPGVNGSPLGSVYKNATSASHVKFFVYKFINDTTGLIATNARGGDDIPYLYLGHQTGINAQGGDGGRIEIYPSIMINNGKLQGGRGGDARGFRDGNHFMIGNMIGGRGGSIRVFAMNQADSITSGQIIAGCGGSAEGINQDTVAPGLNGELSINFGTIAGTLSGCGTARIHSPIYHPIYQHVCKKFLFFKWSCHNKLVGWNFVGWDPEKLKATSLASFENIDDLLINVGEAGTIDLSELQAGAIAATESITIVAGKEGVVDLSQVTAPVLKTKRLSVLADKILLPDGKVLTPTDPDISALQMITEGAEEIQVAPAQLIYKVEFSNPPAVVGEPNSTVPVDLTLLNTGPGEDTYTLTVTNEQGWVMDALPETVTINSQRRSDLSFNVTLPATPGAENLLTITATSQGDPEVQAVAEIRVGVTAPELVTPRDGTKADFSLVVDNTATMGEQIQAVSNAVEEFLSAQGDQQNPLTVELISFKDDDEIISRLTTNNLGEIIGRLRDLRFSGGDTCPHASVAALEYALSNLNPNGQILLVTAAPAEKSATEVITQLQAQGIKTHVLLAGTCGDEAADKAFYEDIATATQGTFNFIAQGSEANTGETLKVVAQEVVSQAIDDWCQQSGQCATEEPAPILNPGKAYGKVVDKFNQPQAGVTITIGDKTTTTNDKGTWEIANLPEGKYTIQINQPGYKTIAKTCEVGEDQPCVANLQLESFLKLKVSSPTQRVSQGNNVTYSITVTNQGQETAKGVVLQETLPVGTQLVSLEALNGGTCDTQTLRCALPDLIPNTAIKFQLTIANSQANSLTNTVTLVANDYPVEIAKTVTEVKPYLSVVVKDTPDPVAMQGQLHYEYTVKLDADATDTATGVNLITQLPVGVAMQTTPSNSACDTSQLPTVTCPLPNLTAGSQETVKLDVLLKDPELLVLTNEAKVTADNYPTDAVRERTKIVIPDNIKVDMVFVIDTTGSMQQEIDGVITAMKKFIAEIDLQQTLSMALVTFKDEVKVEAFTQDPQILLKSLDKLKASGGGMCPEASVEALEVAVKHLKEGGTLFFSTDASPYDDADVASLIQLIESKNIKFHAIVTGDCSNQDSWNEVN